MKQITELKDAVNQLKLIKAGYILKMGEASSVQFFELRDNLQAINLALNELNRCDCGNDDCRCNSIGNMVDVIENDLETIKKDLSK